MVSPVWMFVTPLLRVIDVPLNEATVTPLGMAEDVVSSVMAPGGP